MAKINVMPKHLAELIAAGEVVERPASIVKELLENAIDAGADTVTLEIRQGGISYIRISDNGSGIERDDIRNAFVSHATSKIKSADDLNSILTLGFRGEALASIAAVAKVEVLTAVKSEKTGTRYSIEYGEEILLDDAGCPAGTTITVRDLFLKTPARMKFLKKDVTEANAVASAVDRIALSHPEVSFRFIRDGKQALMTSGKGDLLTCIREVFGKEFASGLIPCENQGSGVKVSGYISKPQYSRP
ncbi:MAG: ATP-binding protein, partial [Clostridia bacterium]|nr:ATP-binding protein [Clostridia bacterium]